MSGLIHTCEHTQWVDDAFKIKKSTHTQPHDLLKKNSLRIFADPRSVDHSQRRMMRWDIFPQPMHLRACGGGGSLKCALNGPNAQLPAISRTPLKQTNKRVISELWKTFPLSPTCVLELDASSPIARVRLKKEGRRLQHNFRRNTDAKSRR